MRATAKRTATVVSLEMTEDEARRLQAVMTDYVARTPSNVRMWEPGAICFDVYQALKATL